MSAGRIRYLLAGEKSPKTAAFRLGFQGGELVLTEGGRRSAPASGCSRPKLRSMSSSTSARRRSASAKSGSARSSRPSHGACTRSCATSASSPASAAPGRTRSCTRARLSPFALARGLSPGQVSHLSEAIDSELERGLELRERGAKDARSTACTRSSHEPCHVCGTPIERVDFEEHTIFYCPQCQTSGRLLKDRRLSRLLRSARPRRLIPVGLLVPVVLVGWGTACALTCWRRLGLLARVPALVVNELPFAAGYLLIASIGLALAQGDLDSVSGAIVGGAGLVVSSVSP